MADLATQEPNIRTLLNSEQIKNGLVARLGDMTKTNTFISSVLEVVRNNELLKEADPTSVLNASLVAVSLNLPINANLGFAYIVPYNQKQSDGKYKQVAQFQLGYKGFIQLAQRSGVFKTISATAIYEGQIVKADPLTGYEFDFSKRTSDTVIGYAGYFKLLNGFEKLTYTPVSELIQHGKKYSKTYAKGFGLWATDFEAMALKTVIKLLLSKYAPLSVDMQTAITTDQAVIGADGNAYPDNEQPKLDVAKVSEAIEQDRIKDHIASAESVVVLQQAEKHLTTPELKELYASKLAELTKK